MDKKLARAALEFYAAKANYISGPWKPASPTLLAGSLSREPAPIETDRGAMARAALSLTVKREST